MLSKFFIFILNAIFVLSITTDTGMCASLDKTIEKIGNEIQNVQNTLKKNDDKNNLVKTQNNDKQDDKQTKETEIQNNDKQQDKTQKDSSKEEDKQDDLKQKQDNIKKEEITKQDSKVKAQDAIGKEEGKKEILDKKTPEKNNTTTNTTKTVAKTSSKNRYANYKSLMFNDKDIEDIFKLSSKIGKGDKIVGGSSSDSKEAAEEEEEVEDNKQQLIDENNIMIYLDSIMYISGNHWAVWLNGSKITDQNNGDGEVMVMAISPLKAVFEWSIDTGRWEIINANKKIPETNYKITNKGVKIYFSLSPNQTYLPSSNKIIEGKIKIGESNDSNENKESKIDEDVNINKQDVLFF